MRLFTDVCPRFHITDGEESKVQKSSVMYRDHRTSESGVRLRTQVSLTPEPWYSFTKSSQGSEPWREGTAPRAGAERGHGYTHPSVWIHLWEYNWLGRGGVFWKCRHPDILKKSINTCFQFLPFTGMRNIRFLAFSIRIISPTGSLLFSLSVASHALGLWSHG